MLINKYIQTQAISRISAFCPPVYGAFLRIVLGFSILGISACGTNLPVADEQGRHLEAPALPADSDQTDIPDVVTTLPLAEPEASSSPDLYSVVAFDVSVRELLLAMARDAALNIDVHPGVTGEVSLNAIDQSIPQILERISYQIPVRWQFKDNGSLLVEPDTPYWEIYKVDYVNVARSSETSAEVSTSIVSVGGSDAQNSDRNTSTLTISQNSTNNFWESLTQTVTSMLGDGGSGSNSNNVISNPQSGLINVRATAQQHTQISRFISFIESRSLSQVMIEATVVEVDLSDQYQSGVDWGAIIENSGNNISFSQDLLGVNLDAPPTNILTISAENGNDVDVSSTVRLLSEFGDLQVLSSPKIMALNNQAAMLRVVDNKVYFTIDVTPAIQNSNGGISSPATFSTNVQTVPVGFVMTVTPQISENDQVTLNVRPTISRIVRYVDDPNPELARENVVNQIPEIQIRELESILKVYSGDIAVLGGLMQDSLDNNTSGLPVVSKIPGIRNLFSYRDDTARKTELIVFIRPIVIRQPSLTGDLEDYRSFLPENGLQGSFFAE